MLLRGLLSFRPTGIISAHERKVQKHEAKLNVFSFFECVKIVSVGLKLNRPRSNIGLKLNRPHYNLGYCFQKTRLISKFKMVM